MLLTYVFTGMLIVSVLFGLFTGRAAEVGSAAAEGAAAAVQLCVSMGGMVCLWSGVMEVMSQCGLAEALARRLSAPLKLLFPRAGRDPEALSALAANCSANLLGLGNAATPAGVRAASLMHDGTERASDELCRLVVLNTASIQLIPSTLAAVRAAAGAASPFDILPAVWLASVISAAAGLAMAALLSRFTK